MTPLVWLDLCSGLGGASQPALDRGWKVIRVDIDARFKPDIVADVRALPLKPFHVDVLWASPPCQEFSKHNLKCFYPNPPPPDLSIAKAIVPIIGKIWPKFWVIENVLAARPWLNEIYGPVRLLAPGHAMWTNLGFLIPSLPTHKGKFTGKNRNEPYYPDRGPMRAAMRAKMPYEIGEAICRAVEQREADTQTPRGL